MSLLGGLDANPNQERVLQCSSQGVIAMTFHTSISAVSIASGEAFGFPSIAARPPRWPIRPSAALVRQAKAVHLLGPVPLAHLLAELQGADPSERVDAYARLAPIADFVKFVVEPSRGRA
jgi:hypothetical protein